jgi:uncharacterized protein YdeI (YjbR/CyaY-like superfamily)
MPKRVSPKTRAEWRAWLEKNHPKEKKVILIRYKKHTGRPSPSPPELMKEAICWGWIDTTVKRLDEDRYTITYVRRKEKTSKWSNNTQRYARELIASGLMSEYGKKMYEQGLKKPTHDFGLSENPLMPEYLRKELEKKKLLDRFESVAPSQQKMYFRAIERAKQPETKKKRIKEIMKLINL